MQDDKYHTLLRGAVLIFIVSIGKYVAPICCVIPPASASCTFVCRILSNNFVFAHQNNKNNYQKYNEMKRKKKINKENNE